MVTARNSLISLIVVAGSWPFAVVSSEPDEMVGPVVRMSVGIERFCRGEGILAFIAEDAEVPDADPDRIGPRGRIVVSRTEDGVNVLVYPPADVEHMFDAQMEFDSFLFGAGRVPCSADLNVLPVLGSGLVGLEFGADENDEPEIRFNP